MRVRPDDFFFRARPVASKQRARVGRYAALLEYAKRRHKRKRMSLQFLEYPVFLTN
jgi:hypothetical protein